MVMPWAMQPAANRARNARMPEDCGKIDSLKTSRKALDLRSKTESKLDFHPKWPKELKEAHGQFITIAGHPSRLSHRMKRHSPGFKTTNEALSESMVFGTDSTWRSEPDSRGIPSKSTGLARPLAKSFGPKPSVRFEPSGIRPRILWSMT
jgi:hypothetical protein